MGAALVARDGTIDWWCREAVDGDPLLFRLLEPSGAAITVGPAPTGRRLAPPAVGEQRYEPGSLVLSTVFRTGEAELELCDFLPWEGPGTQPAGRLVRILTARRGPIDVSIDIVPGGAWHPATHIDTWSAGMAFGDLVVRSGCPLQAEDARSLTWGRAQTRSPAGVTRRAPASGGVSVATRPGELRRGWLTLRHGERAVISLDRPGKGHRDLTVEAALELRRRTLEGWRRATAPLSYDGPYADLVARLVPPLLGLLDRSRGFLAGSATASLPRRPGGERNLDARLTSPLLAGSAVGTFERIGLADESVAVAQWLNRLLEADGPAPAPAYSSTGAPAAGEEVLDHLGGRRGSQPVRVGWPAAAEMAHQLDWIPVAVAALDPVWARRGADRDRAGAGGEALSAAWDHWAAAADWLAEHWDEPSRGPWDRRGPAGRLAGPVAAAAAGLGRMAHLVRARNPLSLEAIGWRQAAADALDWLDAEGRAQSGGLRMDTSPADTPDAALLVTAWMGPWPSDHPLVAATVDRMLDRLSHGPFVFAYPDSVDDGYPAGQGAGVLATAWAVRALAELGRWEEAHARMAALSDLGGRLGLLPEQVDPISREFLGNLPGSLAQLATIDAAVALAGGPR